MRYAFAVGVVGMLSGQRGRKHWLPCLMNPHVSGTCRCCRGCRGFFLKVSKNMDRRWRLPLTTGGKLWSRRPDSPDNADNTCCSADTGAGDIARFR